MTDNPRVYKDVTIVDENGSVLGGENLPVAKKLGLIRLVARIYVLNESGMVLLQRRSASVSHPLKWDVSSAGHVDFGETVEQSAVRELSEELGIVGVDLSLIESLKRYDEYISSTYKTIVPDDVKILLEKEEVVEIQWLSPSKLDSLIADETDSCTPSLIASWSKLRDKIINT